MAIRNVVQVGDDVLRKKCFEVTVFDEKLATLLDDMKETVRKEEGAGLAAPQVGILRRAVVIDVDEGFYELVNPIIVESKGDRRVGRAAFPCAGSAASSPARRPSRSSISTARAKRKNSPRADSSPAPSVTSSTTSTAFCISTAPKRS